MYMDECKKALEEGERIEISKVGSIIPEVKVHEGNFNLPMCNNISPFCHLPMKCAFQLVLDMCL